MAAQRRSDSLRVGLLQVGSTRGFKKRLVFTPHVPTGRGTVRAVLVGLTIPPHPKSRVCSHSVKGLAKWEHVPAKLGDLLWVKRRWK